MYEGIRNSIAEGQLGRRGRLYEVQMSLPGFRLVLCLAHAEGGISRLQDPAIVPREELSGGGRKNWTN